MPAKKSSLWPLILFGAVLAVASFTAWRLGYFDSAQRDRLIAAVGDVHGSWTAAAIFMGCWIVAVILCLPTTVITIIGGALFGVTRGALLSWSAALLGTVIAHTLARSLSTRGIRRLFGEHRLLETLNGRTDIWLLVRMRVVPAAPFGVVDYVSGLAKVPLRALLIATAIGMAPGTIAYAFAGSQLRAGLAAPDGSARNALLMAGGVSLAMMGVALVPWAWAKLRARPVRAGADH
ncbi:MAG: VTT domain-containing protein [Gemmatimonadaceae bacterium]